MAADLAINTRHTDKKRAREEGQNEDARENILRYLDVICSFTRKCTKSLGVTARIEAGDKIKAGCVSVCHITTPTSFYITHKHTLSPSPRLSAW